MTIQPQLKYLCLGPPHSGTGYVSKLLTSFDIVCGHEHIFHQRIVRDDWSGDGPYGHPWEAVKAESAWTAIRNLDHPILQGVSIIHILRNPLHTIESLWKKRGGNLSIDGLRGALEVWKSHTERTLSARDDYPEQQFAGYSQYQVESGPEGMSQLLGLPVTENVFDDRTYNSHMHGAPRELVSWDIVEQLVECELSWFREISNRFGY